MLFVFFFSGELIDGFSEALAGKYWHSQTPAFGLDAAAIRSQFGEGIEKQA